MLRIMSFVDPSTSKELILPVTPATYTWNGPTKLETVSLDQLGEATLHGGTKMGDGSLEDVLLPAQQYPFLVPGGRVDPEGYIADLEAWRDNGAQLQWIVSDTGINLSVMIESITKGERDGTNDRYITITMKQWQRLETPVLALSGGGATTARDSQTGAASTKTYTVQSGDCLWNLAEKYYGDGTQYKKLAAANPEITNPNLIYPGQVLTIPPADDLPAASPDSASTVLSDQLQWTGSGWTA